jgi:hypothetical protein
LTKITPDAPPRPRRPIIAALAAAADHIITGFAIAGAVMYPGACSTMLFEADPHDPAQEPPEPPEA